MLSTLHVLSQLILTTILRGTYPYYHFREKTDREINAQHYMRLGQELNPENLSLEHYLLISIKGDEVR